MAKSIDQPRTFEGKKLAMDMIESVSPQAQTKLKEPAAPPSKGGKAPRTRIPMPKKLPVQRQGTRTKAIPY
jgi:hypothetical protein